MLALSPVKIEQVVQHGSPNIWIEQVARHHANAF